MDQQTRYALKQDSYVNATTHGLEWAQANRRTVIVSSVILLAVIVIAVLAGVLYTNREEKASVAFGAAMQAYQTPLAPKGQPVPPGVKTFPDTATRAKAASQMFMDVFRQYGHTPVGKNALYFAGITYLEGGQNAAAESALRQVSGVWDHNLANLGHLALAELYRETGRTPQAIDELNAIIRKPSTSVPAGTAQLQLAGLYEGEHRTEDARRIWAQLKDKDAKGPAGMIAAAKLNPSAAPNPALGQ